MRLALPILFAGSLLAQEGQQGARPNWPCVPGRAMDPNYLDLSESTGGQLVLFRKGEVEHAGPVMSAAYTHPATILRVVGQLNGTREFEFPVDSTVQSILLLSSVQCRERVLAVRPSGVVLTGQNSAMLVELKSATILRVDQPEPGKWKVRLQGSGLYVLSVLAKAEIGLTQVASPEAESLEFHLAGQASRIGVQLVDATGAPMSGVIVPEGTAEGSYTAGIPARTHRYRVLVTGQDSAAWPFQRVHPNLFRPPPPKAN